MLTDALPGRAVTVAGTHLPATLPRAHARIRDLTARIRGARSENLRLRRGIRDELITLVNTHVVTRWFANDALARLGLPPLPGRYLLGASVPVTVTVDAPTGAYAAHAAAVQVVTELRGLRHAQMRGPTPSRKPPADPVRDAVSVFHVVGLPRGGSGRQRRYTVTGAVRLAVTVHAPDKATARDAAYHALRTDLHRLRPGFVAVHLDRLGWSWVRAAGTPALAPGSD